LQALLQGALGARGTMGREELLHLVTHRSGAESAQSGNSTVASERGDLLRKSVPVSFEVVPCNRAHGRLGKQRGKKPDVILLPQPAFIHQGQRATRQLRLGKRG